MLMTHLRTKLHEPHSIFASLQQGKLNFAMLQCCYFKLCKNIILIKILYFSNIYYIRHFRMFVSLVRHQFVVLLCCY
jgi:hypothetical protein